MNAISGNFAIIVGLVIVAVGAYLYLKRRKANAAVTASTADILKSHLQAVNASVATSAAESRAHVNEMGKFLVAEVRKVAALVTPAPSPVPAAPAASVASAPPPAEAAPAAPTAAPQPVASGPEWPHIIAIDGINVMAKAPINPAWKASSAGHIFGAQAGYVYDPSNGDKAAPPQPLRSAAGYPLKYALGAGGAVVGTPSVLYGDQSFNSDAEVADFIAKTGSGYEAALAARDEAAANQVYTGPVPVASLNLQDKLYLYWKSTQPGETNYPYKALSGTALAIRQAINDVGNEPALLQKFDAGAYSGPLKAVA